jgi:hypothetical protein
MMRARRFADRSRLVLANGPRAKRELIMESLP